MPIWGNSILLLFQIVLVYFFPFRQVLEIENSKIVPGDCNIFCIIWLCNENYDRKKKFKIIRRTKCELGRRETSSISYSRFNRQYKKPRLSKSNRRKKSLSLSLSLSLCSLLSALCSLLSIFFKYQDLFYFSVTNYFQTRLWSCNCLFQVLLKVVGIQSCTWYSCVKNNK